MTEARVHSELRESGLAHENLDFGRHRVGVRMGMATGTKTQKVKDAFCALRLTTSARVASTIWTVSLMDIM